MDKKYSVDDIAKMIEGGQFGESKRQKNEKVIETIQFYGSDHANRRSVPEKPTSSCLYNGPDGKHCAFARYVKTEFQP